MNHSNGRGATVSMGPAGGNSGSQGPAAIILPGTRLSETNWWWLI